MMEERVVTGTFSDRADAQRAINDLRSLGYGPDAVDVAEGDGGVTLSVRAAAGDESQLNRVLGTGITSGDAPDPKRARDDENHREAVMQADDTALVSEEAMVNEAEISEAGAGSGAPGELTYGDDESTISGR